MARPILSPGNTPSGALLLAAVLLLTALPGPALRGAADLPSRERELEEIRREIGRLEERLERVRERAGGLAGELETLEVELALQEQRLAEARSAGDLASGRVAESEAEVARLGDALAAARADLTRRLGGLYRLGSQGYLRMLLSLEGREADGGGVLQGIRILRYLARRDSRAVERYTAARRQLQEEQDRLVERRRDVERWVAEEEERRRRLAAARRRQATLLARVEEEERSLARRSEELADKARRLEELLDLLAGEGSGGDGPAGTPVQRFRGVLDRPVEGEVSVVFGPRLDPRYRTRVPHNGLTFAAPPGSEVRAVYAGEVLYAAPFQGYGPTVVVHHPGRVFTLYAGLATLAVERGEAVALGRTLGTAGGDLYFEVRLEKRPEDPERWLR